MFPEVTLVFPSSLVAPHFIHANLLLTQGVSKRIVVLDHYSDSESFARLYSLHPEVKFVHSMNHDLVAGPLSLAEERQEKDYTNQLATGLSEADTPYLIFQDQDDFVLDPVIYERLLQPLREDVRGVGLFKRTFPSGLQQLGRFSLTTSLFACHRAIFTDSMHLIPAEISPKGEFVFDTLDRIWIRYRQDQIRYLTDKDLLSKYPGYLGMRHAIATLLLHVAGAGSPRFGTPQDVEEVLDTSCAIFWICRMPDIFPHLRNVQWHRRVWAPSSTLFAERLARALSTVELLRALC